MKETRAVFDLIWTSGVKEMVLAPLEVNEVNGNRVLTCLCKGRGAVEEGNLRVEELTFYNVKLGKPSIDRDTLRMVRRG